MASTWITPTQQHDSRTLAYMHIRAHTHIHTCTDILISLVFLYLIQACVKCCRYLKEVVPEIRNALDGKNLVVILTELGTRFHKLLLDHLYQYIFTDVGEYTKHIAYSLYVELNYWEAIGNVGVGRGGGGDLILIAQ